METQVLSPYLSSIYTCYKCRSCITSSRGYMEVCPMNERYGFFTYSSGGVVALARGLWDGALELSYDLSQVVYSCTMCRACMENCQNCAYRNNEYFDVPQLVQLIRKELVAKGFTPPLAGAYFKSIHLYGNPFKMQEKDRGKWAEGLGIERYSGQEYLYYVGDEGSFDERGQKAARAVARLLLEAGVSFGILGAEEKSDGNEVKVMGECQEGGLFQYLANMNIQQFSDLGVKKIIALSPHSYNALKNDYPEFGGKFEVVHYTQLLSDVVKSSSIKLNKISKKVTYHDPCYLGRHNEEYEAPRSVLKAIPGLDLIEMDLVKQEAFCCGGGGGNFYTDMLGNKENSPQRIRVKQAYKTGAEILAVACPVCAKMLEDGIKAENMEGKLEVRDIAEILEANILESS